MFDRFLTWFAGVLWRRDRRRDRLEAARRVAKRTLLCTRCSCPLFPLEFADRLCFHCKTFGSGEASGR